MFYIACCLIDSAFTKPIDWKILDHELWLDSSELISKRMQISNESKEDS